MPSFNNTISHEARDVKLVQAVNGAQAALVTIGDLQASLPDSLIHESTLEEKERRLAQLTELMASQQNATQSKQKRGRPAANDRSVMICLVTKCAYPGLTLHNAALLSKAVGIGELKEKTLRGRTKKIFASYAPCFPPERAATLEHASWDSLADTSHPHHATLVDVIQAHATTFDGTPNVTAVALEGLGKLKIAPPSNSTRRRHRASAKRCRSDLDTDGEERSNKNMSRGGRRPRFHSAVYAHESLRPVTVTTTTTTTASVRTETDTCCGAPAAESALTTAALSEVAAHSPILDDETYALLSSLFASDVESTPDGNFAAPVNFNKATPWAGLPTHLEPSIDFLRASMLTEQQSEGVPFALCGASVMESCETAAAMGDEAVLDIEGLEKFLAAPFFEDIEGDNGSFMF